MTEYVENKTRSPRIDELDYLRGLAIIAIVMQHLMGYINHPQAVLGDIAVLSVTWHLINYGLPAFVVISGAANYFSCDPEREFNYKTYLWKRTKQTLGPYVLWTIFYYYINGHQVGQVIWEQIKELSFYIATGRVSYHLWYIVMIFQFYLLFPLFRKAFRYFKHKFKTERMFFIGMITLFLLQILGNWFYKFVLPHMGQPPEILRPFFQYIYPFSYLTVLLWVFYLILGGVLGLYPMRFKEWVRKAVPYIIPVWFCLFIYLLSAYNNLIIPLSQGYSAQVRSLSVYHPVVAVYVVLTILLVYRICMVLSAHPSHRIARALKTIGKYSFGIYLAHPFVLQQLAKVFYGLTFLAPYQKFYMTAALTVLIIVLVMIVYKRVLAYLKAHIAGHHDKNNQTLNR